MGKILMLPGDGIGTEVIEQVEFGAFQKLGDKSTKKQGIV